MSVCACFLCEGMQLTLYLIGLQVEVLQGGGYSRNGGKVVIRKVQFHQTGEIEDLWMDAAALQTTVTQTKVLQVEKSHKTVIIQLRESVVGQIELLDRWG